jgi:hypothetical protein
MAGSSPAMTWKRTSASARALILMPMGRCPLDSRPGQPRSPPPAPQTKWMDPKGSAFGWGAGAEPLAFLWFTRLPWGPGRRDGHLKIRGLRKPFVSRDRVK